MMTEVPKNMCTICGEPMPEGEEMFFFHGYSGPCPKPTISAGKTKASAPGRVLKISTQFVYPPIPSRSSDWCAVDDDTYDGEGGLIGRGATEIEAIADLLSQIDDNAP